VLIVSVVIKPDSKCFQGLVLCQTGYNSSDTTDRKVRLIAGDVPTVQVRLNVSADEIATDPNIRQNSGDGRGGARCEERGEGAWLATPTETTRSDFEILSLESNRM
jgi:hypothetical protein